MNRWKKSRDNRGMSLVMVIGTVALVSILVVIVLSLSLMNIQMKSVYKKSADNFYDAEAAMDEIRTGLQQDVADAATTAYLSVMSQFCQQLSGCCAPEHLPGIVPEGVKEENRADHG